MKIISSSFDIRYRSEKAAHFVVETHVWEDGHETVIEYGPVAVCGIDPQSLANARVVELEREASNG